MQQGYRSSQVQVGDRFAAKVRRPLGPLGHLGPVAKWGCWLWVGDKHKSSTLTYGRFRYGDRKRNVRAHRLMWELVNGPIPEGMFVLHHCDNPLCVKPGHLYLGTASDNSVDMRTRGRAGGALLPHGKLREEDVAEIREIWEDRVIYGGKHPTMKQIGAAYGVSDSMVCLIVNRVWWKDV
jgi:hypothetical protein